MSRDLNVDQIKKLWILDLVIQFESLKKASIYAKVTPSAISQTITSLENSIGKPLLQRADNTIRPTAEALAILNVIRPAFEAFDRLKDLNNAPIPKISWMNFGTYESIAIDILPGLLQHIKLKLPNVRLSLRTSRTSNLLTMLRKGELCSALITEVDDLSKFYVKDVSQDRMGFYISKKHPLADDGWSAVKKHGLGTLAKGKDGFPRYYSKFMRQFSLPKPIVQSDSFEILRASTAAGSIVTVLPNRVAKRFDDLIEITQLSPDYRKTSKEKGIHRICVVSQTNCDREETDFIAEVSENLLRMNT